MIRRLNVSMIGALLFLVCGLCETASAQTTHGLIEGRITDATAYYQTPWFLAASVIMVIALCWALHQFRLRRTARIFNLRLDERVNERTRIARELHDTLLQSFQGLMLRFQSARDLLPAHPEKAVEALDKALERADQSTHALAGRSIQPRSGR
ncbi:MAG: histidine kinase [Vicinamibacteraceae bacterium]